MSRITTHSRIDKALSVFITVSLVLLSVFLPQLRGANGAALISPLPTPSPTITTVTPANGSMREAVRLTIMGENFIATPSIALGLVKLINVEFVSSSVVKATIPTGKAPGVYTLRLCNPNLDCVEKADAYTVEAVWPPVLMQILPAIGPRDMPNDVTLFGRDMQPGVQISIGNTLLQNITWLNPMIVQAVVPSGMTAGIYDVTVRNPSTSEPAILHNAYTVIDPFSDDFYAGPDDLWTLPHSIHEGDVVQLGLVVHRNGGATAQQVQVDFYAGDPSFGGTRLGTATTPPIPSGAGNLDATYISWNTAGYSSTVDIYAVIDPGNLIAESNKLNNTAKRTITILSEQRDEAPPRVISLTINDGVKVTHSPLVTITLIATDTGGSGVQSMYLVDRMYNAAAHQWVAVQSSGWIPYHETFTMTLTNHGGVHYIQAWVADGQGNISMNFAMRRIDYIRKGEHIRGNDVHLYQRELLKGEQFTVNLDSLTGDADLYVWGPGGGSSWVSLNSNQMSEHVTFAVPVSGAYSVEVYGVRDSDYDLEISGDSTAGMLRAAAGAPAIPSGKTPRTAPVTAPESTPINEVAVPSAPPVFHAYIPFVSNSQPVALHPTYIPMVSNDIP